MYSGKKWSYRNSNLARVTECEVMLLLELYVNFVTLEGAVHLRLAWNEEILRDLVERY